MCSIVTTPAVASSLLGHERDMLEERNAFLGIGCMIFDEKLQCPATVRVIIMINVKLSKHAVDLHETIPASKSEVVPSM